MTRPLAAITTLVLLTATCRTAPPAAPAPKSHRQVIAEHVAILDDSTPVLRFNPPPVYAMWRAEVEQCSGRTRAGSPAYYVAPVILLNRSGAMGVFIRTNRRIVFGLGFETVSWIVRHEQLHDILDVKDGDAHPPEYFQNRCGSLVYPVATEVG